jgi:tetratricopeptide (TPR) repeat protein
VALTAGLLLAFSLFVVAAGRQRPWLLVGWLWFLVTLLPVLGLVQVGLQAHADRYAYVPHVGLFILIVWGIHDRLAPVRAGLTCSILLAITGSVICISLTRSQIRTWKDTHTLWSHALTVDPTNYCALREIGILNFKQHELDSAQSKLLEALHSNPDDGSAVYWLGRVSVERAEWDRAAQFFSWVLRIDSHHAGAARHLAVVSQKLPAQSNPDLVRAASVIPDQKGPNVNDPAPSNTTGVFIDVHTYGGYVIWPWGHTYSSPPCRP